MNALLAALPHLSPTFREKSAHLWVPEHLDRIARRVREDLPDRPLPHFEAEITPTVQPLVERLRSALSASPVELVSEMEHIGIDGLLLLLGQRRTPIRIEVVRRGGALLGQSRAPLVHQVLFARPRHQRLTAPSFP